VPTLPDRAVIFDFNGTFCDDEPLLLRIFTEMFADTLGWTLTPEEYAARLAGRSDRTIIDDVVGRAGRQPVDVEALVERRLSRYLELVAEESPIRPGSAELVRHLGGLGVPVGIVTGAARLEVDHVLETAGLVDDFAAIVSEEDVSRGKPDPEGFLLGASRLGIDPGRVLVFEDSVAGLRGARDAGMTTVAITGTYERDVLVGEAEAVVDSLGGEAVDVVSAWLAR